MLWDIQGGKPSFESLATEDISCDIDILERDKKSVIRLVLDDTMNSDVFILCEKSYLY